MKTIRKKIIVGLMSLLIILPQMSLADGMMMPPQDYWIQETGQKAVIMYEDGIETMVISTSFEGDANDFAWVIPTPNKPEVSKGSQALFTNLDQLTGYTVSNSKDFSLGIGAVRDVAYEGVTIVEEKQIDYYDVTVLSSTDKDSLVTWLNDNEYNFPTSASYILNSYVDNDWYFVAMKVNPESLEWTDVSKKLRSGEATPVVLQFEAKNIVYPMRISSIVDQEADKDKPIYPTGVIENGIEISNTNTISFSANDAFSTTEGTVEIWIKPDSTWENSGGGYWEFLNVVDSNNRDVFEFRRGKDSRLDNLQFIAYNSSGSFMAWKTPDSQPFTWVPGEWYHLAVTWSEINSPVIYVNGVAYELVPAYSETSWNMKDISNGTVYLGQRGAYGGSLLKGEIDELRISDNVRTAEQIKASYAFINNGNEFVVDSNTLFLSHFNSSLKEEVSGKNLSYKTVDNYDTYSSNYVPVTLYVMAVNKKTLPNFSTNYANWIDKESIEKLALDDQGDPLLSPSNKKYFLTKLYRNMTTDQMTEDLFFRDAENNETSGKEIITTGKNSVNTFYLAIGVGLLLSFIFAIAIFVISRKVD
ncbi:MAG: DUF2330 domain-containing protein [candidate division Zixibacteria bacterium]|nr:DUF2330 domain-containing protein [candidate division Zixibacteria bacterium]